MHRRNVDLGRVLSSVFQGVADQILKYLLQVRFTHADLRQGIVSDARIVFPDGFRQAGKSMLQNGRGIHRR